LHNIKYIKILFLLFSSLVSLNANHNIQSITLQLDWKHQFKFAGYYIAKEKGFYKDIGLHVKIKEYNYKTDLTPARTVVSKKDTYGIGKSSLIITRANGEKIVALAALLQSSPLVFISKKSSSMKNYLNQYIGSRKILSTLEDIILSDLTTQRYKTSIDNLISDKKDIISGYLTDQIFTLKKRDIEVNFFYPKDYGFDFYSDILFTSETEVKNHKKRAIDFTEASLKGWEYAFSHIDETVKLILDKYNSQNKTKEALIFEAKELKKLAYFNTNKLGTIDKNKIKNIYGTYNLMGFVDGEFNVDDFIFNSPFKIDLTKKEKQWIQQHPVVKYSEIDWRPLSIIEKDTMTGILGDFLNIIEKRSGIKFKFIPSSSWQDALKQFKTNKIDLLPANNAYFTLGLMSNIYKKYPMVIVTNDKYRYIESLDTLNNKIIAVPKHYTSHNYMKKNYPNIKIVTTKNIQEALTLVHNKKADAFIGHIATTLYYMKQLDFNDLKISGRTKFEFKHNYLIQKEYPELLSIINKTLDSITQKEKNKIFNNWININIEEKIDYEIIWKIVLFSLIIVLIFLYRNRELKKYNTKLKTKIEIATHDLLKAQKISKIGSWKINHQENSFTCSDEIFNIFEIDKTLKQNITTKEFIDFVHDDYKYKVKNIRKEHLKNQKRYLTTYRLHQNKEKVKYIEEVCETVFDTYGKPILSEGTLQDITKQRLTTLALLEKDKQILQQSRLAQMGEMLSMISHQWRQPLNAINIASMTISFKIESNEVDIENIKQSMKDISIYSQYLSHTIDDFSNFFAPDKEPIKTNYNDVLQMVLKIIETTIKHKDIKVYKKLYSKNSFITFENELKQVVLNLIQNSIHVLISRKIKNPRITIETYDKNNQHILMVKDNAGGVSDDIIDKIFDPYFSTKENVNGKGLGLYMSKIIIEKHCHGKLETYNDKFGAVFIITL